MNTNNEIVNNPFFKHHMNKLCAVCHIILEKDKAHSIFTEIPKSDPVVNAFQVLEFFSNFNIYNGPQKICTKCFNQAIASFKFIVMCNKAHENILNYLRYQKDMKPKNQEKIEDIMETVTNTDVDVKSEEITISDTEVIITNVQAQTSLNFENAEASIRKHQEDMIEEVICISEAADCSVNECDGVESESQTKSLPWNLSSTSTMKLFECKICNKSFKRSAYLKFHESTHTGDGANVCKHCGKVFTTLQAFDAHQKMHSGFRRYKCNQCDSAFTTPSHLKQHEVATHSTIKPFQCEICAKRFGRKTHLKQHMVTHSSIKEFECELCGSQFTQLHSLKQHLKTSCRANLLSQD